MDETASQESSRSSVGSTGLPLSCFEGQTEPEVKLINMPVRPNPVRSTTGGKRQSTPVSGTVRMPARFCRRVPLLRLRLSQAPDKKKSAGSSGKKK